MATDKNKEKEKNTSRFDFLTTDFLRGQTIKQKHRNTIAIGLYAFVGSLILALILTHYNILYLQGYLGIDKTESDIIFSYSTGAGAVGLLLAAIVGGAVSDDYRSKYGARAPFILLGCVLTGIMLFLTPIFGKITPTDSRIVILPICFFLMYVGLGLGNSPNAALLSELFTKEQRGWMGLIIALFATVGTFLGVIILKGINDLTNAYVMFVFTGIIAVIGGIFIFFLVEKANPTFPPIDDTITDIISTPRYLISFGGSDFTKMLIVQSLWGFSFGVASLYLIPHIQTEAGIAFLGAGNEGLVLIITGIVAGIMAIPAGLIIKRLGKIKTAMVGSFIYGIFCVGFAFMEVGNYYSLIFFLSAIAGFGAVFIESVRLSLPADLVPEGKEAQFMGINKFASTWTQPLVSLIGAQVLILFATSLGGNSPTLIIFLLAGVSSFLATGVLFLIKYEKMIMEEYHKFYQRYRTAKAILEDKLDDLVDRVI
ncbi:MAG: MFS transporter [Candidatus Hodarchaeales archaeon]